METSVFASNGREVNGHFEDDAIDLFVDRFPSIGFDGDGGDFFEVEINPRRSGIFRGHTGMLALYSLTGCLPGFTYSHAGNSARYARGRTRFARGRLQTGRVARGHKCPRRRLGRNTGREKCFRGLPWVEGVLVVRMKGRCRMGTVGQRACARRAVPSSRACERAGLHLGANGTEDVNCCDAWFAPVFSATNTGNSCSTSSLSALMAASSPIGQI
jgi:hypothetical protein